MAREVANLSWRYLTLSLVVLGAVGYWHGGLSCWIQDLNYFVAALPLAFSLTNVAHFRLTKSPTARLRAAVFFATFWVFLVYAWRQVSQHQTLLARREAELAPIVTELDRLHREFGAYPPSLPILATPLPADIVIDYSLVQSGGYILQFRHNLIRRHVHGSARPDWRDE